LFKFGNLVLAGARTDDRLPVNKAKRPRSNFTREKEMEEFIEKAFSEPGSAIMMSIAEGLLIIGIVTLGWHLIARALSKRAARKREAT
jgi:hypothetical protein